MNNISKIIQWQAGELSQEETADLFQNLIDTGQAWELQGIYGQVAKNLIDQGLCSL